MSCLDFEGWAIVRKTAWFPEFADLSVGVVVREDVEESGCLGGREHLCHFLICRHHLLFSNGTAWVQQEKKIDVGS